MRLERINTIAPHCDECGLPMNLRKPKRARDMWEPFWGCKNFPSCKYTLQIDQHGNPEYPYVDIEKTDWFWESRTDVW
ncbi:MAG TPA: hypothetical protein ENI23_08260 [bacterium]|nr:hypothetical protein [bacterium]